jgi:hypothetical protein
VFIVVRNIVSIYRKLFKGALSACDEVERKRVDVTGVTPEAPNNGGKKERKKVGR